MTLQYNKLKVYDTHFVFIGVNAMHVAAFFSEKGREPMKATELYGYKPRFKTAVCWGLKQSQTAAPAITSLIGDGVHAKIYELTNGDIILGSQNNGSSGLVETAILYPAPSKRLVKFIKKSIGWLPAFQQVFRKTIKINLGGST